jgi:hypothetical protein
MVRLFASALLIGLGACAAPSATDSTELDRGTLPVGLVHSERQSTSMMSLTDPQGGDGLAILLTLTKPVITVEGVASEPDNSLNTFATETFEALNQKWEAADPRLTKQQVEKFFQALEPPDGVTLEAHVKVQEGGKPKIGLDLVKYDGSTG